MILVVESFVPQFCMVDARKMSPCRGVLLYLIVRILAFSSCLFEIDAHRYDLLRDHHDHHHHHQHGDADNALPCALRDPTIAESLSDRVRIKSFQEGASRRRLIAETCEELCDQCIEIPINLHLMTIPLLTGPIIPHPTDVYQEWTNGGSVSVDDFSTPEEIQELFLENVDVLNKAYKGTPFRFALKKTSQSYRLDWNREADEVFKDMSAILGTNDPKELDVFLALELTQSGRFYLGFASNAAAQETRKGDGVFMRYDTLTDGGLQGNDKGYILVHETGKCESSLPDMLTWQRLN